MQEQCGSYSRYQALRVPKCNCKACWFKFFTVQVARYTTARAALETMGREVVSKVQGSKYLKFLELYIKEQECQTATPKVA